MLSPSWAVGAEAGGIASSLGSGIRPPGAVSRLANEERSLGFGFISARKLGSMTISPNGLEAASAAMFDAGVDRTGGAATSGAAP
jgi:hypothetical protein